jgi:hypothetical protein
MSTEEENNEVEKRVSNSLDRSEMKKFQQAMDNKHKLKLIQKMCQLTSKDSVARSYLEKTLGQNQAKESSPESNTCSPAIGLKRALT